MGRTAPFKMVRVDREICDRLGKKKARELRRDDMTQYIEYVLDRYSRDLYVDIELYNKALQDLAEARGTSEGGDVRAVRVRKPNQDEHRKTG